MLENVIITVALIVIQTCIFIYSPGANALPIKSEIYGGGEEESVSMYARSPLPENKTSHTISVKNLDVLGPSPAMLLPQHANPKALEKSGTVFMKRSDDSINIKSELQKTLLCDRSIGCLTWNKDKR